MNYSLYISNTDKFAILILILIMIIISLIIWVGIKVGNKLDEKERKEIDEAEHQRAEEERKKQEQENYINSTLCHICQKHSYGFNICQNCIDRSEILFSEIPNENILNFDRTHEYYLFTKNNIISAKNKHERETNSIRAISVASYLEQKYLFRDPLKELESLFEDIKNNNYEISEEIIQKYSEE